MKIIPQNILNRYWGYKSFRINQEKIITAVAEGRDTLALMPTGGGKSLCYQIPALMKPGICLVVTPLIALMKDQVEQLKGRKIKSTYIHSAMTRKEIDTALDNCVYGDVKFLYLSPERLKTELFLERLQKMDVNLLAVDEAHCISEWGYDFRPAYLGIGPFRENLEGVNIIALTATATPKVEKDIIENLRLQDPHIIRSSFLRANLVYGVRKVEDKYGKLIKLLRDTSGSGIVYARTRKETQQIQKYLKEEKISSDYYHAGLTFDERSRKQEEWTKGKFRVMVATNAFGMGIDKPDVRLVAHMDIPENLESYYQEAGRAGRDGKRAYCVILYQPRDKEAYLEKLKLRTFGASELREIYQSVANYCQVAEGSGAFHSFDFDLRDFAFAYRMEPTYAFQGLKKLSELGLIQLSESYYQPSKLHVNLDQRSVYKYIVEHEMYGNFLKGVLRAYGGELFSDYLNIREDKIARVLETTEKEVREKLNKLNKSDILHYIPQNEKPQVAFLTPRHNPDKLPLNKKLLAERNQILEEKAKKMLEYVQQAIQCRSVKILDYFGEHANEQCGNCDVCIEGKKSAAVPTPEISAVIREKLTGGALDPGTIINEIDQPEKQILSTIREMLDSGKVRYNEEGKLALNITR